MNQDQPNMDDDRAGERLELARLWMGAQGSVLSFICAAIPKFHDAEDVLQQVAMEAAKGFHSYDPSRPFVGWVLGIARRRIARYFAANKSQPVIFSDPALEALEQRYVTEHSTYDVRREALDKCIGEMDGRSREILDMRYEEALNSEEISARAGVTVGSIRVILTRIRKKLAECVRGKLAMDSTS